MADNGAKDPFKDSVTTQLNANAPQQVFSWPPGFHHRSRDTMQSVVRF